MTIDRTYRCDLCSDMHKPDDGQLVGIYWAARGALEIKPVRSVEHHLCCRCIEAVASIRLSPAYSPST